MNKKTKYIHPCTNINTHNGVLFDSKKEGYPDKYYDMDEPGEHYVKWNKPVTKGQTVCVSTYMRYLE